MCTILHKSLCFNLYYINISSTSSHRKESIFNAFLHPLFLFSLFLASYPFMSLLLTDDSSIINSIQEIHTLHVDLNIDNPHVWQYTGRQFSWVNNLPGKTKQFTSFAEKPQGLQGQKQVIKWRLLIVTFPVLVGCLY